MKIREVTVHAGRTFNDPYESYSNFRPGISIRAEIEDDDVPGAAIERLRCMAEEEVEATKGMLLERAKAKADADIARYHRERDAEAEAKRLVGEAWRVAKAGLGDEPAADLMKGLTEDDIPF